MRCVIKITLTVFILIAADDILHCAGSEIKTWEVFEISLKSSVQFQNPYVECLKSNEQPYLTAIFTGIEGSCKGKTIRVPGFWDGGDIWKIRFAPSDSGTWKYETFSADRKMKGKKGELKVTEWSDEEKNSNPVRHGFITVNKSGSRNGRYFTYSDGTPVLWIADTWWDWTNSRITFESFRKLADTRAEQGFNIGQLFFAGNGYKVCCMVSGNVRSCRTHIRRRTYMEGSPS